MSNAVCPACGTPDTEAYASPFPDPLVRCRSCGARFVHPVPGAGELRARYEREHADGKWADLFEAANPADPPRRADLLRRLAGAAAALPLLDVGCGDGAFLDAARTAGWRAVGMEIAWGAASAVAGHHPVFVGTVAALQPGRGFGAVTFWDVLEHLADPAAVVASAARLLAPGGLLAASLPNARGVEAVLAGARWRYHDVAAYGHLVHLGPRSLGSVMERGGLRVVHVETRGSVDLRDRVPVPAPLRDPTHWLLDRASGVVARVAEPLGRGNTLLVVARRP